VNRQAFYLWLNNTDPSTGLQLVACRLDSLQLLAAYADYRFGRAGQRRNVLLADHNKVLEAFFPVSDRLTKGLREASASQDEQSAQPDSAKSADPTNDGN